MYRDGFGSVTIAERFNTDFYEILRILKRNGITLRTARESARKYTFNEAFFETIDVEEKAYFLGFILADGSIDEKRGKLKIALAEKDYEILEKFNKIMGSNVRINKYKRKTSFVASSQSCELVFCSPKIVQDLKQIGITERKTFIVKPPEIRSDLKKHFWRGVMDGDGHVSLCKPKNKRSVHSLEFGICGKFATMEALSEYLTSLEVSHKITKDKSIFRIRICNRQALRVLDEIYEGASIFLKRKHEKYLIYKKDREVADSKMNPNKGIYKTSSGRYQAMSLINVHGFQKSLGTFDSLEEAVKAQEHSLSPT